MLWPSLWLWRTSQASRRYKWALKSPSLSSRETTFHTLRLYCQPSWTSRWQTNQLSGLTSYLRFSTKMVIRCSWVSKWAQRLSLLSLITKTILLRSKTRRLSQIRCLMKGTTLGRLNSPTTKMLWHLLWRLKSQSLSSLWLLTQPLLSRTRSFSSSSPIGI